MPQVADGRVYEVDDGATRKEESSLFLSRLNVTDGFMQLFADRLPVPFIFRQFAQEGFGFFFLPTRVFGLLPFVGVFDGAAAAPFRREECAR